MLKMQRNEKKRSGIDECKNFKNEIRSAFSRDSRKSDLNKNNNKYNRETVIEYFVLENFVADSRLILFVAKY